MLSFGAVAPVTKPEFIARQSSHPRGLLGHLVAFRMSFDTARANRSAVEFLQVGATDSILEIACGHGRTLARVAALAPRGFVAGLDRSEVMLRQARWRNRKLLRQGRVQLHEGESAHIPYPDGRFDKALAVHVLYFLPDPRQDLAEIHRVLRPGGLLVLGFRPKDDPKVVASLPASVYTLYTRAEVEKLLTEAGFAEVAVETRNLSGRQMSWALARA